MNAFLCVGLVLITLPFVVFSTSYSNTDPGVRFIQNKMQWNDGSLFAADVTGGRASVFSDKLRFTFISPSSQNGKGSHDQGSELFVPHFYEHGPRDFIQLKVHIYDMQFVGANATTPVGTNPYPTVYNYYFGNDPSCWATRVTAFSTVYYESLYDKIDLKVYSQDVTLKYEWIVKQEGDPGNIRVKYNGLDNVFLEDGKIHLKTSIGEAWELAPYAYQIKNGCKVNVPCEYVLKGDEVTYAFPEGYDACYDLVIDPILIFSAYSGSTLDNWGNTATYDSKGNVYSGGMVRNPNRIAGFPATPGAYQIQSAGGNWDIGILKYDSAGSGLLYATYLGGSDTETPQSLVVNANDELLLLGATGSVNFPVTNGSTFKGGVNIDPLWGVPYAGGTDIFVARLSSQGDQLQGATYIGGTDNDGVNFISGIINQSGKQESPLARNYGDQLRGDIITDENNFVYIVSCTRSADFPASNTDTTYLYKGGALDAIVVKLAPDLSSIVWSRFIGGNDVDAAYSIKLFDNKVFVAGGTQSFSMAGMNGLHVNNHGGVDGWVQSFSSDGVNVIDGTFLGTPSYDQSYFIDLNEAGEVYVFGQTQGSYPLLGNVYSNPGGGQFIHKLSNDLATSIFSTRIGSGGNTPNISPTAFLVTDCNNLYLGGWGGSANSPTLTIQNQTYTFNYVGGNTFGLPVTPGAFQTATSGNDFYFMVLSADASEFLYGTFFGGTESATHVDGGTSRFDKQGIVYHAVCAGCGGESDFPAINVPSQHQQNRSTNCNNAVFKFDLSVLKARLQTNSEQLDEPGFNTVCIPDRIVFQNRSSGGKTFEWNLGDTLITKTDTSAIVYQYKAPGTYHIKLKAIDPGTCKVVDSTSTIVYVFQKESWVGGNADICGGTSHLLQAGGGVSYLWKASDGSDVPSSPTPATPLIQPEDTTHYYVTITEASGCVTKDTIKVNVIQKIDPQFDLFREGECLSIPGVYVRNRTEDADDAEMFFEFGDGESSDVPELSHRYEEEGVFEVKLTGRREFCVYEKSVTIPVFTVIVPNIITPEEHDGRNDTFVVQYGRVPGVTPADFGLKVSLVVYNRWGKKVYESEDYQYDWAGDGLPSGVYYYDVSVDSFEPCRSWLHLLK